MANGHDYATRNRQRHSAALVRQIEVESARQEAWAVTRPDWVSLDPPHGWRNPVSGRRQLVPDPRLLRLGRYLRRARHFVRKSQQRIADESGVTQSMVSRAERALAPGMGLGRVVAMAEPLGRAFPLGVCPHEHDCAWQPIQPPAHQQTATERLVEMILGIGAGSEPPAPVIQDD